ncbi:TLC domain-containing protein 2 [Lampetra fluviatilis]
MEAGALPGPAVVLLSAGVFWAVARVAQRLPAPRCALRNAWKWRNSAASMVHGAVTGSGAVLCFYSHPEMAEDLIGTWSPASHCLVAVSIGYFLNDLVDMLLNQKVQRCWELLLHHLVVIVCFGVAVLHRRYVGFATVALLVEINSVFLHGRQLMLMAGLGKTTAGRVVGLLNLGTFAAFRISTLAWMTRWLVLNRDGIPAAAFATGSVGMALVTVMNIVLFYRLLRSDLLHAGRAAPLRGKETGL